MPRLKKLDVEIAEAQKELAALKPELAKSQAEWEKSLTASPAALKDAKLPKNVAAAVKIEPPKRSKKQGASGREILSHESRDPRAGCEEARGSASSRRPNSAAAEITTSLITEAVPPRTMRILPRGNWQDDSGAVVLPAVPEFLGKLDIKDRRPTRLDLAHWMVAHENPLVARVLVNRLWRLLYGEGLARTWRRSRDTRRPADASRVARLAGGGTGR